MKPVYFFLGANSEEGFFSLYDQLLGGRLDDLMILKGGPGCGKSTFMRRVGAAMERAGERIVYINCSGDPDSLDATIFLDRNAAIVDGTSPHVLEPTYAVASERYVDLTRFYDVDAAKVRRAEIVALSDEYRAHYRSGNRQAPSPLPSREGQDLRGRPRPATPRRACPTGERSRGVFGLSGPRQHGRLASRK